MKKTRKIRFKKFGQELSMVLLSSLLIPCLLPVFQNKAEADKKMDANIEALNAITIGTNREWFDETFGVPLMRDDFEQYSDENQQEAEKIYTECLYSVGNYAIVRAYFSEEKLDAFFVTISNDIAEGKIHVPKPYEAMVNEKPLGDFSYYEISGKPLSVEHFISVSTSATMYNEKYHFGISGNQYIFAFASLDYGLDYKLTKNGYMFDEIDSYSDDEVSAEDFESVKLYSRALSPRNESKPNTYGILGYDCDNNLILSRLFDERNFDVESFVINRLKNTDRLQSPRLKQVAADNQK